MSPRYINQHSQITSINTIARENGHSVPTAGQFTARPRTGLADCWTVGRAPHMLSGVPRRVPWRVPRKATEAHPYGYTHWEALTPLLTGERMQGDMFLKTSPSRLRQKLRVCGGSGGEVQPTWCERIKVTHDSPSDLS